LAGFSGLNGRGTLDICARSPCWAIPSDLDCVLHSATYIRCQTQNVMGSFCEISWETRCSEGRNCTERN